MQQTVNKRIACIGVGNMGGAILSRLASAQSTEMIYCYDIDAEKQAAAVKLYGIQGVSTINDLTEKSDIIIIAVKPDGVKKVLTEARDRIRNQTIISIAAGVSIESITAVIGPDKKILRVMPNTPAKIGEGMIVISPHDTVGSDEIREATDIFGLLGRVAVLPERMMDAVTAVSGSGPAYVFMLIQAMTDGAVKMGIPRKTALELAAQTAAGAARLVLEAGADPIELRGQVTSPGGTTIDAVHVLERAGFSGIVMDAIEAAAKKSEALGRKS
ncbi:MAG TPA: pyrroline-5-carboxylate reductase [Spirochaetota bacterium]|nr:pyrroline-5-carboxylate reductase [Spirochaetota bacterium]HOS40806.1 pyrroline-5-carboxylate reductase [Spirochaetota bacterium]HPU88390.1 pyrroline-5-carboxylate reductase [Spirochaetota bacterium]